MYTDVEQLIEKGLRGKWVNVSAEERDAIIASIQKRNTLKNSVVPAGSGQGGDNLRHYARDGYIVVCGQEDVEDHPADLAARKDAAVASAKALLGQS